MTGAIIEHEMILEREGASMDQDVLPGMGRQRRTKRATGRVERAVSSDLTAARRRDTLPPDTGGLSAAARAAARLMDDVEADTVSTSGQRAYALSQAARVLMDAYRDLGLTGTGEGGDGDAAGWLESIGAAEIPHRA